MWRCYWGAPCQTARVRILRLLRRPSAVHTHAYYKSLLVTAWAPCSERVQACSPSLQQALEACGRAGVGRERTRRMVTG